MAELVLWLNQEGRGIQLQLLLFLRSLAGLVFSYSFYLIKHFFFFLLNL